MILRFLLVGLIAIAFCQTLFAADPPATQPAKRFVDVNVEQFLELSKNPDTVILDVRTAQEYADGHIPGSVLIDVNSADFAKRIAELDKSKTYLVHCRSGVRSVTACNKLADIEFSKLYNLLGGINAWRTAGKPVEKWRKTVCHRSHGRQTVDGNTFEIASVTISDFDTLSFEPT